MGFGQRRSKCIPICGCVKSLQVARRYTPLRDQSRRWCTRVYYLNKGAVSVRVCKKAFLKIHDVSNGRLDQALRAHQNAGGSPHCDQRGRHEPGNKTKTETVDMIKAHIDSFPRYKSHYSRNDNPNREFLTPFLTIHTMYGLYKEKCEQDNTEWRMKNGYTAKCLMNTLTSRLEGMHMHATNTHSCMHACMHTHTHTH